MVAAGGAHLTCSYDIELQTCNSSVLEQFAGLVPDYPKLVRALSLVACGELRSPATALIGLALLEEATQQPYDLISLE
ncbi:hypothetical protein HYH02_002821 [Chlamydomonas schloesseri]|uniref:Uncharacterized protein n=1 Tax=Chlamydomonas schloesseri TaxID=2026947 RepID=A0A835WSI5_9CHLO|nr:hypothetical protein HYH02_002821 [Chlamydomonas schloesseri]|eukprot:KAG2452584.1 hypothetical protein HYH02_002821 [Chlamydomonas schloesseri]